MDEHERRDWLATTAPYRALGMTDREIGALAELATEVGTDPTRPYVAVAADDLRALLGAVDRLADRKAAGR